jgi:hypothetical protein
MHDDGAARSPGVSHAPTSPRAGHPHPAPPFATRLLQRGRPVHIQLPGHGHIATTALPADLISPVPSLSGPKKWIRWIFWQAAPLLKPKGDQRFPSWLASPEVLRQFMRRLKHTQTRLSVLQVPSHCSAGRPATGLVMLCGHSHGAPLSRTVRSTCGARPRIAWP